MATTFPDRATLESALDIAARAPSLRNLQPWRWRVDGGAIDLFADWSRQAGDAPSDRRDVLLGCGAVLDHCVVALAAAGWQPRVHRFPDRNDGSHLAILEVVEQPPSRADLELAAAIARRRADRRPYRAESIPPATLELLYIRAARMGVELAVVPKSRWALLDGGGVALQFPTGTAAAPDDSALLVLGTRDDDDAARLRAGEALSHLTLTATAMGLASCPLTEPLDDIRSSLALACEVFDGEAHPQALIRVGLAPSGDDPLPTTQRRSVNEVTVWAESR
ncbi:MAG: nitroreductase [Mycobacterium sp.]|nr:MAG: nitroreductase [Mycobacterium sp.]